MKAKYSLQLEEPPEGVPQVVIFIWAIFNFLG